MLAGSETPDGKTYGLVRDKDMPAWLAASQSLGFMGSDTYAELNLPQQNGLTFAEVAATGLRFALAAPRDQAANVAGKLQSQETIRIVTSNPRTARQAVGALGGSALRIVQVVGGSVEVAPHLLAGVDAIFDIVDSGQTLRENGLEIVADNLAAVSIGAVWRKEEGESPLVPGSELDAPRLQAALAAIETRVEQAQTGEQRSYTQTLAANPGKLIKKFGEETSEFLEAFLIGEKTEVSAEAADVLYALAIACGMRETSLTKALNTLAARNK